MTSDPWAELEKVPEPLARFRLIPSPYPSLSGLSHERLTSRAWTALYRLGWSSRAAVVCGDIDKLRAVVGVGQATLGEIARLRRRIIHDPG